MKPLLFSHIPKTAGTSFREAYSSLLSAQQIFCDYGEKSPKTSPSINDWVINRKDFWLFKKAFDQADGRFMTGHFPVSRYLPLFGVNHTVTFLREPLQRIRSEYDHFVRNYDYQGSFGDFYEDPRFTNRQSKMLGDIPVPAISVVGLTERYSETLKLFQHFHDVEVPSLELNVGNGALDDKYQFSDEDRVRLERLNQKDIRLYSDVCEWHQNMVECMRGVKLLVRGMIGEIRNKKVQGWAVAEDEKAVEIEIFKNGDPAGRCWAIGFRPRMCAMGIARKGYVGFEFDLSELRIGDRVHARVANTCQKLYGSEIVISKVHL